MQHVGGIRAEGGAFDALAQADERLKSRRLEEGAGLLTCGVDDIHCDYSLAAWQGMVDGDACIPREHTLNAQRPRCVNRGCTRVCACGQPAVRLRPQGSAAAGAA